MVSLKEYKEEFKKIQAFVEKVQRDGTNSLNGNIFSIGPKFKYVFEEDGRIVKIQDMRDTIRDYLIPKYTKANGCPIFVDAKLEALYPKMDTGIISQSKIEVIPELSSSDFCQYCDSKKMNPDPVNYLGIEGFLGHSNIGKDENGDYKIFDCVSNTAGTFDFDTREISLHGELGETVYKEMTQW